MTLLRGTFITIAPLGFRVKFALQSVYAGTTEGYYSEVLEQQAAMHANYPLVKFDACSVRCKQDQDMNAGCTSPLNMGLGFLLVLLSTLQAALQNCHLPTQNLPFAAGLHQPPLKLHATYRSEYQVTSFVWRIADQGQTSSLLSVRIPVHTAAVQYWR